MQNLIYYPTFEPENETWLKYALIYLDEFSPIVPPRAYSEVSEQFRKVENETDLVKFVGPEQQHGIEATHKVIQEIKVILGDHSAYGTIFNIQNILETWTNPANWTQTLWIEKLTDHFIDFCIKNHFGRRVNHGIELSPELCGLYMTFLAETIAYQKQATPIIDSPVLDRFSTYLRAKDVKTAGVLQAANVIVQTALPSEIENINIDKVIKFRTSPGIAELRRSFNITVESFYNSVENEFDPYTYLESIKRTNGELTKEIGLFFGGVVSLGLGALILSKTDNPSKLEVLKASLEGTIFSIAGAIGINSAWKLSKERRNARKFLTNLKRLGA
ncbi:MAG: hypothetical protein SFU20_09395 [Chitinophagaceae bacterium]|nr:hypothetical protein [Chitinophagaceae bacterium]